MKKYLITSKEFYTDDISLFCSTLSKQILKHKPHYVLFRDKQNLHYKQQAKSFVATCEKFKGLKYFIHSDVDLAKELNATGVHLTSTQFNEIRKAKELGLEVIISTHSHVEVQKAKDSGVDAVTYSPIFLSPNKGEPKGIDDLKKLTKEVDINIFALGGIVKKLHVQEIKKTKVYGFASIRYFY